MIKKTVIAGLVAAACGSGLAQAQQAPASPHTITGNVGFFSQYIFRGLTQTNAKPALQGGFDYSHSSGLYAGTWASNVSWLVDTPTYLSQSLEWDFYGGYKGTVAKTDLGYDVGLLYYWYPGTRNPGCAFVGVGVEACPKADTLEVYGALSWKWLSGKFSYSVGNQTFGVPNSDGTWYLDLSVNYPITDKLTAQAHYGIQEFSGSTVGVSNDSFASYEDYKVGFTYALPQNFTLGAFLSGTDMSAAQKAFYTNISNNRFVGKDTVTLYIQKTF